MSMEIKPLLDVPINGAKPQSPGDEKAHSLAPSEATSKASGTTPNVPNDASHRSLFQQRIILHMISLSDTSVSTDWGSIRLHWKISGIVHCPEGIQNSSLRNSHSEAKDEFGNCPDWVYILKNEIDGREIPVGPIDVERLYEGDSNSLARIALLRKEKDNQLLSYKDKLDLIRRLHSSLNLQPGSDTLAKFIKLAEDHNQIGDEHFEKIDRVYSKLQDLWSESFPDVPFNRFLEIYQKLNGLNKTVSSRKRNLSLISTLEGNNLNVILTKLNSGNNTSKEELSFLMSLHEKLLRCQNYFKDIEATSWARHKAVPVDINQEAKTPAYHANLKIANLLSPILLTDNPKVILDIGSNLSNFYRILKQAIPNENEESTRVLENVIDLEKDPVISACASNPNKIVASIGEIDDSHLPKIQSVSNERTKSLITNPNNFDILVTSFVLDQLDEDELRNTILAFEELLKKPPDKTAGEMSLEKYPALVIASPEHSPLAGSNLEKILEKCGYRLIAQEQNVVNSLTHEAQERIKAEEGPESLSKVETLISKPYHVYVYAKVEPMDKKVFGEIPAGDFVISLAGSRKRTKKEGSEPLPKELNIDRLLMLDIVSSLRPADFNTKSEEIVARENIYYDQAYADFEDRLACLIYFKKFLSKDDQRKLEAITSLWDIQGVKFLSKEQADFVMERPLSDKSAHVLRLGRLMEKGLDALHFNLVEEINENYKNYIYNYYSNFGNRRLTLWDLYKLENKYRYRDDKQTVLEEVRSKDAQTLRAVRMAKTRLELSEAKDVSPENIDIELGIWCIDNNIKLNRLSKTTLLPKTVVKTFKADTPISERIKILSENIGLSQEDLRMFFPSIELFVSDQKSKPLDEYSFIKMHENLMALAYFFGVKKSDFTDELPSSEVVKICSKSSTTVTALRLNRGLSRAKLARLTEEAIEGTEWKEQNQNRRIVDSERIELIEIGRIGLTYNETEALAKVFDLSPTDIYAYAALQILTSDASTGEGLLALREFANLSVPEMVGKLNELLNRKYSTKDIIRWESGEDLPPVRVLEDYGLLFKVNPRDIHKELSPDEIKKRLSGSTSQRLKMLMANSYFDTDRLAREVGYAYMITKIGGRGHPVVELNKWKKIINQWMHNKPIQPKMGRLLTFIFQVQETDIDPDYYRKLQ